MWAPLLEPDDIRVLDLEPAMNRVDPISYQLRTISLKHPGIYYTLSYVWGKAYADGSHLTHCILCDGLIFPITANLHVASKRHAAFGKSQIRLTAFLGLRYGSIPE